MNPAKFNTSNSPTFSKKAVLFTLKLQSSAHLVHLVFDVTQVNLPKTKRATF